MPGERIVADIPICDNVAGDPICNNVLLGFAFGSAPLSLLSSFVGVHSAGFSNKRCGATETKENIISYKRCRIAFERKGSECSTVCTTREFRSCEQKRSDTERIRGKEGTERGHRDGKDRD